MNHNLSRLYYISGDARPVTSEKDIKFNKNLDEFNVNVPTLLQFNIYFHANANNQFELTTTYPGLLLGVGYSHPSLKNDGEDIKNETGDFQLGFFFDHTTGLPVIPGSSVKGVLKSVFPKKDFSSVDEKLKYIKELTFNALKGDNAVGIDVEFIKNNWEEIFFGSVKKKRKHIFHDAYISNKKPECNLFEDDYITPHGDNIFKNPIPIRFLKVSPGVTFTFQFKLKDFMKSDLQKLPEGEVDSIVLSKESILKVFKQILLDFGIGAKRNVGYGQFK